MFRYSGLDNRYRAFKTQAGNGGLYSKNEKS
jgi:hypothetical protein